MGYTPRWRKGDWIAICDRCGLKFPASRLRKDDDGLYVCRPCFEPEHPLDDLRGIPDRQSVPWVRYSQTDSNVGNVTVGNATTYWPDDLTITLNTAGDNDPAFQRYNTAQGVFESFTYVTHSVEISK